ncbi:MAG: adenylosuccinate lyase [Chloroflexota bacterium]|nr:MAG: adenylosuccinate lyase [Chloroflexota bacterium]
MFSDPLFALSPLDGRYARAVDPLRDFMSEYALFRDRIGVEIAYLRALSQNTSVVRRFTESEDQFLLTILELFATNDAKRVQELEMETRHDVKAVEYYLREKLQKTSLEDVIPFLHFGLTSEDVNQTAIAFSLLESRDEVLLPKLDEVLGRIKNFAKQYAALPLLAKTHGQPAVPTTLGKEFANFYVRLLEQRARLAQHKFSAKLTGAVGNFNALTATNAKVDWIEFSARFLQSLGLEPALYNTQLMPYDNWLEYFDALRLTNSILLDFAQDVWRYISDEVLKQKVKEGEIGSSTMPQKVNPIDFENAEGNIGIANALLEFYARKLPVSRLQRDLSDSTVRRTFGVAFGHTLVAWQNLLRGLDKIEPNIEHIGQELEAHWEIVAEGAQTILRAAGVSDAYEQLKTLTRGKPITRQDYEQWVYSLNGDTQLKTKLLELSPQKYIGLAEKLTEQALGE